MAAALVDAQHRRDEALSRSSGGEWWLTEEARLLEQLTLQLRERLRLLEQIDELKKAPNAEPPAVLKEFDAAGPYPVARVDRLRDELELSNDRLRNFQARLQALEVETTVFVEQKKRAEEGVRQAKDEIARKGDSSSRGQRELDLAELRRKIAETGLAVTVSEAEIVGLKQASERVQNIALAKLYARVRPLMRFSGEDLDEVRLAVKANSEKLAAEISRVTAANNRRERERGQLLSAAKPENSARLRVLYAELESDRLLLQMLSGLETLDRLTIDAWEARFTAFSSAEKQKRDSALERLEKISKGIEGSWQLIEERLESARSAVREQAQRLEHLAVETSSFRQEEALLRTLQARVHAMERAKQVSVRLNQLIVRWLSDFRGDSDSDVLARSWQQVRGWAKSIWDYELFAVEDVTEIDGQKVSVSYGVTVRKSVGALLLFVLGYWLLAFSSRGLQYLMVKRLGIGEHAAQVSRRWIMIAFALMLLVIVLNLVRIPLTVFAFLGGALAIGIGFGTQTIIKNLISGIIILFERKIRVGDIIQLGGMIGQVTAVDLRASTVRGVDGVEALVPNSTFLETQVVNWTYSNPRVRRAVKVGVAYGTDVASAAELLLQCARTQAAVLGDPSPEVLFEDFGDNALQLVLYFWVELGPAVSGVRVESDLRFAIHTALEAAGIAIPFPQRDIRIDQQQALRVQLTQEIATSAKSSN